MADGIKGALAQAASDIGEAIVQPVTDEVGKAIEEGTQSVVNTPSTKPLDPVAQQAKQMEEQKKKAWAMRVIEWYKKIQEEQQKVHRMKQQEGQQKKQEEDEKQKVKQYQVIEQQKKAQQLTEVQKAARKTELKGGVGG